MDEIGAFDFDGPASVMSPVGRLIWWWRTHDRECARSLDSNFKTTLKSAQGTTKRHTLLLLLLLHLLLPPPID